MTNDIEDHTAKREANSHILELSPPTKKQHIEHGPIDSGRH